VVAAWIGGAYWFTASTSFANPAITIARSLSDTFAGIRPIDVPGFIVAQLAGALGGLVVANWLFQARRRADVGAARISAEHCVSGAGSPKTALAKRPPYSTE